MQVNEKLNTQYPKLLQAVKSGMNENNKRAVVYKFIETLQELVVELKKNEKKT
tara:strand:+ start:1286 stop:1444 length:159 start_codon:yes stop_codon:yes gene_type:complete